MGDLIIMTGDTAIFEQNFGDATIVVKPGTMVGSGPSTINGKKICVDGDEKSVVVQGCNYSTISFANAGVGTLTIVSPISTHLATKTNSGKKAVILKGKKFDAKFTVIVKATNPAGATDPKTFYDGKGSFETTNTLFEGI